MKKTSFNTVAMVAIISSVILAIIFDSRAIFGSTMITLFLLYMFVLGLSYGEPEVEYEENYCNICSRDCGDTCYME